MLNSLSLIVLHSNLALYLYNHDLQTSIEVRNVRLCTEAIRMLQNLRYSDIYIHLAESSFVLGTPSFTDLGQSMFMFIHTLQYLSQSRGHFCFCFLLKRVVCAVDGVKSPGT